MLRSFLPLVKHYNVTEDDDSEKSFKITCQRCNGFVICAGKNGELIYNYFICAGMSTLGLYPKGVFP